MPSTVPRPQKWKSACIGSPIGQRHIFCWRSNSLTCSGGKVVDSRPNLGTTLSFGMIRGSLAISAAGIGLSARLPRVPKNARRGFRGRCATIRGIRRRRCSAAGCRHPTFTPRRCGLARYGISADTSQPFRDRVGSQPGGAQHRQRLRTILGPHRSPFWNCRRFLPVETADG